MDEREALELVSNLSYYEKLILREMLKALFPPAPNAVKMTY